MSTLWTRIGLLACALVVIGCATEANILSRSDYTDTILEDAGLQSSNNTSSTKRIELPRKVRLDVPFSSQAPHANWDDPYQEACEEMSVLMVDAYLQGQDLTPEEADGKLLALVLWQVRNGYGEDVTIEQLSEITEEYFDYTTRVSTEVTVENMKHELALGNPIILPAAGRKLGNPYFSGEGPWYHMLVVTGYDSKHFITNDPGTRRGEGYKYKYDVLLNAVHDWTGVKEEIEQGEKVMMAIEES